MKVDLDPDLVARGVKDALTGGKALLTDEELKAVLAALRIELRTQQEQARKEIGERNRKDGEAFLAENKTRRVTLPSRPTESSGPGRSEAHGETSSATIVAPCSTARSSTAAQPQPAGGLPQGPDQGLGERSSSCPGSVAAPPSRPRQRQGRRTIGPTPLIFEVELLSIRKRPRPVPQPESSAGRAWRSAD
jgi:FKBP-type peptidyl-prolyl cis-trans isomerase FklB